MYLLELSVAPVGVGESMGPYVARAVKIIADSGLDYQLHAMGTIVEGELDQVLDVLRRCLEALATDCDRVTCSAKLDYRRGQSGRLRSKVASVQKNLDRPLKTVAE